MRIANGLLIATLLLAPAFVEASSVLSFIVSTPGWVALRLEVEDRTDVFWQMTVASDGVIHDAAVRTYLLDNGLSDYAIGASFVQERGLSAFIDARVAREEGVLDFADPPGAPADPLQDLTFGVGYLGMGPGTWHLIVGGGANADTPSEVRLDIVIPNGVTIAGVTEGSEALYAMSPRDFGSAVHARSTLRHAYVKGTVGGVASIDVQNRAFHDVFVFNEAAACVCRVTQPAGDTTMWPWSETPVTPGGWGVLRDQVVWNGEPGLRQVEIGAEANLGTDVRTHLSDFGVADPSLMWFVADVELP